MVTYSQDKSTKILTKCLLPHKMEHSNGRRTFPWANPVGRVLLTFQELHRFFWAILWYLQIPKSGGSQNESERTL